MSKLIIQVRNDEEGGGRVSEDAAGNLTIPYNAVLNGEAASRGEVIPASEIGTPEEINERVMDDAARALEAPEGTEVLLFGGAVARKVV